MIKSLAMALVLFWNPDHFRENEEGFNPSLLDYYILRLQDCSDNSVLVEIPYLLDSVDLNLGIGAFNDVKLSVRAVDREQINSDWFTSHCMYENEAE